MTSAEVRQRLVDALILDLVGPIADPSRAGERLEQGPSRWYLTGFLVPNERASVDIPKEDDEDEEEDNDLFGSDDDPLDQPTAESVLVDDSDKNAAVVTSKRNFLPSSMGLSVLVPKGTTELKATVRWGDYHPEFAPEKPAPESAEGSFALASAKPAPKPGKPRRIDAWARQQCEKSVTLDLRGAFTHGLRRQGVPGSDGLSLEWLARSAPKEALDEALVPDGALSVNVYLVNHRKAIHGAPQGPGHGLPGRADDPLRARVRPPTQPERPSTPTTTATARPTSSTATSASSPSATTPPRTPRSTTTIAPASSSGPPGSPTPWSSGSSPASWKASPSAWRAWRASRPTTRPDPP